MKHISFKLKFDEEFGEYYFQPFGGNEDYEWIDQLLEDQDGNMWCLTEHGGIKVVKVDYENNKVICEV